MLHKQRVKLIKFVIDINEKIIFERRLHKAYRILSKESFNVLIDVGANKGQTIDFFKKSNPRCLIYAFEPNLTLYQKLTAKYSADKNIKLFNLGITDSIGKKTFFQNALDYTSSFEALNYESEYLDNKAKVLGVKPEQIVEKTYEVQTTTLAHFVNTQVTQPVDVLKLDVEGHEYPCLVGLFSEKLRFGIRYIQVEKHNDDMYPNRVPFGQIQDLLYKNGYETAATVRHGFGNLEEVIFVSRNVSEKSIRA